MWSSLRQTQKTKICQLPGNICIVCILNTLQLLRIPNKIYSLHGLYRLKFKVLYVKAVNLRFIKNKWKKYNSLTLINNSEIASQAEKAKIHMNDVLHVHCVIKKILQS